ncbi:hypothetical protein GCM10027262_40230 [Nocardia tengchongensis]
MLCIADNVRRDTATTSPNALAAAGTMADGQYHRAPGQGAPQLNIGGSMKSQFCPICRGAIEVRHSGTETVHYDERSDPWVFVPHTRTEYRGEEPLFTLLCEASGQNQWFAETSW